MHDLPTTVINGMFKNEEFVVEESETTTLEAMEADLRQRFASGERWDLAIVEESGDYTASKASKPAKRGMMLLRKNLETGRYDGLHYSQADCGRDSYAVETTARLLCLLLEWRDADQLHHGFLRYYPKIMAYDLGTGDPHIEPID